MHKQGLSVNSEQTLVGAHPGTLTPGKNRGSSVAGPEYRTINNSDLMSVQIESCANSRGTVRGMAWIGLVHHLAISKVIDDACRSFPISPCGTPHHKKEVGFTDGAQTVGFTNHQLIRGAFLQKRSKAFGKMAFAHLEPVDAVRPSCKESSSVLWARRIVFFSETVGAFE